MHGLAKKKGAFTNRLSTFTNSFAGFVHLRITGIFHCMAHQGGI